MRYNIAHGLVTAAQNAPSARKLTAGLPWREAASVMLVSPGPIKPSSGDPKVEEGTAASEGATKPHFLVTQRSKTSGSFSSILCFPGGNTCKEDSDMEWLDRFRDASGWDVGKVEGGLSFTSKEANIPMIYHFIRDPRTMKNKELFDYRVLPKSIILRVTAIRETFEETGILLAKEYTEVRAKKGIGKEAVGGVGTDVSVYNFEDPEEINYWQNKIRQNPSQFMGMCETLGIVPDVNALVEWSDWLTPNCFGMQRYDTIFYMSVLPKSYPLRICPKEVESAEWLTADKVLKDCEERKCKMITPQIYELTRLRNANITKIRQLMKIRLKLGIERWCPAYIRANDGYLSVFPGDDLYPEDLKIDVFEPIRSMDASLDELRETSYRLHRIEYRSEFDFRIVIKNYKEQAGHIYLDF